MLAASGNNGDLKLAEEMRRNYFTELKSSLIRANLLDDPQLAIKLLEMHQDATFNKEVESLCGIITTDHDGLLEVASQRVLGGINPGFEFTSRSFKSNAKAPVILQLHGSFTWRFALPLRIEKLRRTSQYAGTVWIPPTILKEAKAYPCNKLVGLAYELLARECDVLRIVGTSLTQNDWNILSLIFNAQQHREATKGEVFQIELILPQTHGERIRQDCAYLRNMRSIGYLTDGRFSDYKDENFPIPPESDMANPLAYWLEEKLEFHRSSGELSDSRNVSVSSVAGAVL